jgi:hypothetical protein
MAAATPVTDPLPVAASAPVQGGLAAKILKQGKPPAHIPSAVPVLGKPGRYRITHGSLTLGYTEEGERVDAHPGAIVKLTAEEAGPVCAAKTAERLAEDE